MCYKRWEKLCSLDSAVGELAEITANHRAGSRASSGLSKLSLWMGSSKQTNSQANTCLSHGMYFLGGSRETAALMDVWNVYGNVGVSAQKLSCHGSNQAHYVLSGEPGARNLASHVRSGDDCDEDNNEQLSPRTIWRLVRILPVK